MFAQQSQPTVFIQMLYDTSIDMSEQARFWMIGALQQSLSQIYSGLDQLSREEIKREYMLLLKDRTERIMLTDNLMFIKPSNFGKFALIFVSPLLEQDFPQNWSSAFRDIISLISDATIMQQGD